MPDIAGASGLRRAVGRVWHRRARVGLVLFACVTLGTAGRAADVVGPDDRLQGSVEAGELEFTFEDGRVRSVEATGDVTIRLEESILTADSISYDFEDRAGELLNGRAVDRGVIFLGGRMTVDGSTYHIEDGGLTTCDRPDPHYLLSAREIEAVAGEEAILTGAALHLYGRRIFSLGHYRRSLRKGRRQMLPLPMPGYSRLDSLYLAGSRTVRLGGRPNFSTVDLVLSSNRGPRGTVSLFRESQDGRAGIRLSRRAGVPDEVFASLTLDRLPEVFASQRWTLSDAANLSLTADLTGGSYRERPSGQKASRDDIAIGLRRTLGEGDHGAYGGLRYRKSWYSDDSRFEVLETELGLRSQPDRRAFGELAFIHRAPHGATPFEFDDVDIANELRARVEFDLGRRWAIGGTVRYDTAASDVMDQTVSLTHKAHCLAYTIKWGQLTDDFGLNIGLVGF